MKEETKLKISFANKGKRYSQKTKSIISAIKRKQFRDGLKPWNLGIPVKSNNALDKFREEKNGMFGINHPNWKGGLNPMWVRKQRIKTNGGSHTIQEWETLKAQYNWTCPCCKKSEPEIKLTEDHVISLKRGGSDNIENIQPLCGGCNSKKHTKIIKYEVIFN